MFYTVLLSSILSVLLMYIQDLALEDMGKDKYPTEAHNQVVAPHNFNPCEARAGGL